MIEYWPDVLFEGAWYYTITPSDEEHWREITNQIFLEFLESKGRLTDDKPIKKRR